MIKIIRSRRRPSPVVAYMVAYGMFDCTLLAFTRPQLPVLMDLFCLFFALKKGPKLIYYIPSYQAISQLDFDQLSKLIIFYCTLS